MKFEARKTISCEAGEFSYLKKEGENDLNPIIFFHATGLNLETYNNFFEELFNQFEGKRTLIAYDQRGHGKSKAEANPSKLFSWDQYADDAVLILKALEIKKASFIGHSMGAIVAAEICRRNMFEVENLALMDPVLLYNPKTAFFSSIRQKFNMWRSPTIAHYAAKRRSVFKNLEEAKSHYAGRSIFASWPETSIEDYLIGGLENHNDSMKLSCDPTWEAKTFETVSLNSYRTLKNIKVPVLILKASMNSTIPNVGLNYLAKNEKIKLFEVEGTHFFLIEKPKEIVKKIQQFF